MQEQRRFSSRRTFLKHSGVVAAGTAVLGMGFREAYASETLDSLQCHELDRRVGQRFRVHLGFGRSASLALESVTDLSAAPRAGAHRGPSFSIFFHGPAGTPLPQNTYRFEHPELGSFPLFIVPMGANQDGRRYEAIINRLPLT